MSEQPRLKQRRSMDQLQHALERVAAYRKDPTTLLPYARSMIALADEIERLQQKVADLQQFHDWAEPQITDLNRRKVQP